MTDHAYRCQVCGSDHILSILDVGNIPAVNAMVPIAKEPIYDQSYPLELVQCGECHLVQINCVMPKDIVFPFSYPYLSGSTKTLFRNFENLTETAFNTGLIRPGNTIIDIGANDGTLLKMFIERNVEGIGIEPTQAGDVAAKDGVKIIQDFFSKELAMSLAEEGIKADLITATNVFAHMMDPNKIVIGIQSLLKENGVFISENHYLPSIAHGVQYDKITHEHLRYYHLGSLAALFARHNMEIYDAELIPTHGGSIRVYACRVGQKAKTKRLADLLAKEDEMKLNSAEWHQLFKVRVEQSKVDINRLLEDISAKGEKIYGIGAPSRACTLINFCTINHNILDCALELPSSAKIDHYIPGTAIPVLDEKKLFEDQPDYALLLSWHIADELMGILRKKGFQGKFICPLPDVKVY